MKKVLIIGILNDILRSICECLTPEYNVQLCPEDINQMKSLIGLLNPQLVIVNEISLGINDLELYHELSMVYIKKPVLVISDNKRLVHVKEVTTLLPVSMILYRPVTKAKLLEACKELLDPKNAIFVSEKTASDTAATEGGAAENRVAQPENAEEEKKKILVVDDSIILLRNIKVMLENDYQVFTVTSGELALQSLARIRPDVILLDYAMPNWDGRKTFEMISQHEIGQNIPVIFLTSVSDRQHILDVLKLKPFGYILKPPSKDRITEEIRKALDSTWMIG